MIKLFWCYRWPTECVPRWWGKCNGRFKGGGPVGPWAPPWSWADTRKLAQECAAAITRKLAGHSTLFVRQFCPFYLQKSWQQTPPDLFPGSVPGQMHLLGTTETPTPTPTKHSQQKQFTLQSAKNNLLPLQGLAVKGRTLSLYLSVKVYTHNAALFFLVLVLDGVLLIVLLWVVWLPSTGRENVLISLIPGTHHHLACRRRGML